MDDAPRRCDKCGYDLAGVRPAAEGVRCPECGRINPLVPRPAPWPIRRPLAFDVLLLGIGALAASLALAILVVGPASTWWRQWTFGGIGALGIAAGLAVVWGSAPRRRATSRGWLAWHTAVALIGIPAAFGATYTTIVVCSYFSR